MREINPDEVAGFLRRAQELLASGDVQAARLLLLRAPPKLTMPAPPLSLAKTFDPFTVEAIRRGRPRPIWHRRGTGIRKPRNGVRSRRDANSRRLPAIIADQRRYLLMIAARATAVARSFALVEADLAFR